jgi:pseudomonalisin
MIRRMGVAFSFACLPVLMYGRPVATASSTTWVATATRAVRVNSIVPLTAHTYLQPRFRQGVAHVQAQGRGVQGVYEAARNLGALAQGTQLHLVVGLALRNRPALDALVKEQATPGSAEFGRFLTTKQTRSLFGPTRASVNAVVAYLRSQGFTDVHPAVNNMLVSGTATAHQAEAAFHTSIDRFLRTTVSGAHAVKQTVYANTSVAKVPASLGGVVQSVIGLTNADPMHLVHPDLVTPSNLLYTLDAKQFQTAYDADASEDPSQCLTSSFGTPSVDYPQCEAPKTATVPANYVDTATSTNFGTTTAVMAAGNLGQVVKNNSGGQTDNTDLTQYEQSNGLPIEPVTIRCPGTGADPCAAIQPGPYDADYQGEFDLDTQSSTGIAGGVKHLYVYDTFSPLLDANIVLEFNLFQSDDLAKVGSASFGGCEDGPFLDGSMLQIDEALELASSQGQTMFASTGDTGGSCSIGIPNGVPTGAEGQVEYPASSPFVVGAGGTTLFTNTNPGNSEDLYYNYEIPWYAGGGGDSLFEYRPSWQSDVVPPLSTATCTIAVVTCFGKGLPDISMDADPDTGAAVYINGSSEAVGGTSLSSPLAMGSWARLNSSYLYFLEQNPGKAPASTNFSGLPFAAPLLYSFYTPLSAGGVPAPGTPAPQGSNYPFHDIIDGTNTPYVAYPGWDYSTGLGAFDLAAMNYAIQHSTQVTTVPLPTVQDPTCTLGTDPQGDASITLTGNPSVYNGALDILAFGMRSDSGSDPTLVGQIRVSDLANGLAGQPEQVGGDEWYVTWNYNGVTDFLQAQYSPSQPPNNTDPGDLTDPNNFASFSYGYLKPGTPNTYTTLGTATGDLDTTNNLISIEAPASGFTYQASGGNPPTTGGTPPTTGSVLTKTGATTFALVGTGLSGGLLETVDTASGSSYDVGTQCASGSGVTAAGIAHASISRQGSTTVLRWTSPTSTSVVGFNVFASGKRLNAAPIAVRASGRYDYRVTRRVRGPFALQTLLADGTRVKTTIR